MKEKVLTQEQCDLLANLVLTEMGKLREFCSGRPESIRAALQVEIGALHTLYNYLID